ncbi:MAG TPA: type II toxin-antitoxin system prevent-host-death family antitoxin [Azospirillaceae bacterium]|nr:type II toxin-antitoxin system prevent-host-death family antitoxin [Azospirillaceae bacterium]
MGHVTYTDFRQRLAGYMDQVCDDAAPITVTRQNGRSVVVMSEDEYESMAETLHLLNSPANAERLAAAVRQLDAGGAAERDLIE